MSSLDRVPELKADPGFLNDRANLWSEVAKYIEKAREIDKIAARELINSLVTVSDGLQYLDTREAVTEALRLVQEEVTRIIRTADPLGKLFKFAVNIRFERCWKVE